MLDLRYQRDPNSDTDNGDKSMLAGDLITNDQKTWLKTNLLNSTATWKFLISTVPWNPTVCKDDAWGGGFRTEQQELLNFIVGNNITGVIFISGDIHTGGAIDNGSNARCPEMNVPHSNKAAAGDTCQLSCGQWECGRRTQCFTTAGDGYGIVTGSATEVMLKVKDAQGVNRFTMAINSPSACTLEP